MNKLIIALSVACASAYAFGDQKIQTNGWFSASAESGSDVRTGGSWKDDKAPTIDNNKYVIESEIDSPVTFNSGTATAAGDFAEVSFNLETAIVPADARDPQLGAKSPNAKIAFAASEDSDVRAYYAWLGETTGWKKLAGATPSDTDGDTYELFVTFDKAKEKKVQFRIGSTALYLADGQASGTWISYDAPVSATSVAIDFVGSGNVASFAGNQQIVEAEIIVDGDVKVTIKEEDVKKFNMGTETPAVFFASAAKDRVAGFNAEGITVATAYALGLIVETSDGKSMEAKNGGYLTASAVAESIDTEKITFAMNATARDSKDTGVIVNYQVVNESTSAVTPGLTITKPGAGLTKYKVQAILSNAAPAAK